MPRKKPKKVRREQQRTAMRQVRQQTGWEPPLSDPLDELVDDLAAQFPELKGPVPPGMDTAEFMAELATDSHELADEPEFQKLYFHPMKSINAYGTLDQKRGLSDEDLEALSEEEQNDIFWEIVDQVTGEILTQEMEDEILAALAAFRQRVRNAGDEDKTRQAAAVEVLLRGGNTHETWPAVGLVQAIMYRSLQAGLEMVQLLEQQTSPGKAREIQEPVVRDWDEGIQQQMQAILDKYPGLQQYLEEEGDTAWDEGLRDLAIGRLFLGFFSAEELAEGAALFEAALRAHGIEPGETSPEPTGARAALGVLERHVRGLLSAERLEEMRDDVLAMLEDPVLAGEHESFLLMLVEDLQDGDDLAPVLQVLVPAFLGEMLDMAAEEDED